MEETVYKAPQRMDGSNAGDVDADLKRLIAYGATDLVFDMSECRYVSSAGLRVLLSVQKKIKGYGTFSLMNVPDAVREILNITGFSGLLTIK